MFESKKRQQQLIVSTTTLGQRFFESTDLTANLPILLLTKPNGQLIQEIQIGVPSGTNTSNMVQQIDLLQRADPVGGWEGMLNENKEAIFDRTLRALEKRVAEPGRDESFKLLLTEIVDAAEKLKREFEQERQKIEARYERVQTPLRRWQEEYGREPDLLNRALALVQVMLGGHLSLSEVVPLWNKRETLAKARDAYRAAIELMARIIATVEEYTRNLETVVLTARQRLQELQSETRSLVNELEKTRWWTIQTDYARIAEALTQGEDVVLLAEILSALREQGSEKLLEVVATLAHREVDRELAPLDLVQLMERESAQIKLADGLADVDPLILVGENLLDQVRHQYPTWQLVPQARPRVFVLQITPNGENIFDHPGLETARYGDRLDRLGFLQAQFETALDEIQVVHDGADAFKQARLKREYFILEQVVKEWTDDHTAKPLKPVLPAAINRSDGHEQLSNHDEAQRTEP